MSYFIEVKTNYGVMKVNAGEEYNGAMGMYKNIKEEYKSIPCEIVFFQDDKQQFVKVNKENSFDVLYARLVDTLAEMSRQQIRLSREEKTYTKLRNEMYHNLETTDISELSMEEMAKMFMQQKIELNKRRLVEEENQLHYSFYPHFQNICKEIVEYNKEKEKRCSHGSGRFGNPYYKEDSSEKEEVIKKILSTINKSNINKEEVI